MRSTGSKSGFTLLEVILSVAIFLLLASGIFAAVAVTTKASGEMGLLRLESERLDSLQGFLRRLFANLPGTAQVELRMRKQRGEVVELLISSAPEFASFMDNGLAAGGLALAAIPDGAGAYTLSLANFDAAASTTERDRQLEGTAGIALLPAIRQIRWRFAAKQDTGLQETWVPNNGRPGLADLEITLPDGSRRQWQFLIPAVLPSSNGGAQ